MIIERRIPLHKFESNLIDLSPTALRLNGPDPKLVAEQHLLQMGFGPSLKLTGSCSQAIEAIALATGIASGDEVIVPSFTFPTSVSAFASSGATIRFADLDPSTLCVSPLSISSLVTSRTKAIIVVHYGGQACDLGPISEIAASVGAVLIEDCAHAFGAKHGGRLLGTIGDFGAFSFHRTKAISCGDGGALTVNRADMRAKIAPILTKGVNSGAFLRGDVPFYEWVTPGSNLEMSEVHAAILIGRLELFEVNRNQRRRRWSRYNEGLRAWAERHEFRLPLPQLQEQSACEIFYVVAPSEPQAERLKIYLHGLGIEAAGHYRPLHTSRFGCTIASDACPVTEAIAPRLLRLPMYNGLSDEDQDSVIAAVQSWRR